MGNGWLVAHESIQEHLKAGVPADKLVMGLAFYGNGNADGSGSANQISLQEIENGIASGKWTDHWDDVAKMPVYRRQRFGRGHVLGICQRQPDGYRAQHRL